MKPSFLASLSLLSLGLALTLAPARADDAATPPVPPPAPAAAPTSPADGAAQPRQRHRRPGFELAELTQKLSLTADQQKTVGAIIATSRTQMKELRGDDSLSKDDKRQKMKAIMDTSKTQFRAALTTDQQKLFDALPATGGRPSAPPAD